MPSNLRVFPGHPKPGRQSNRGVPNWWQRGIAALFYLVLGYLVKDGPGDGSGSLVFVVLGAVYWALIHRGAVPVPAFVRYHYLQATLLFLLVYFGLYALWMSARLLSAGCLLVGLTEMAEVFSWVLPQFLDRATFYGVILLGVFQATLALLGRKPRIPLVSANVNHWV